MGLWLPVQHRVAHPGSDELPVCLAFEADGRRPASGGAPRGAGVVRIWSRSPHSIRWKSRLPCRGVLPRSVLVQFPVMDCQEWGICLTQVAAFCGAMWGGRPRPRPAPWTRCQRADEDSPPFVNVFFELFFELGRDLFDMGTLSPYPWDLPRSGQQYGWWDSRNCPHPVGT